MKLLVDVGNTRVKYCQLLDDITPSKSFVHQQQFKPVLEAEWLTIKQPESVWVANVAGERAQNEITDYCQLRWQLNANFVQVEKQFAEIANHYQSIQQMGVDRWLAVIGARTIFANGSVIVIDVGTAVNIELLNNKNQYLGGTIMPGMNLMHQALMGNTHMSESGFENSVVLNPTKVQLVGQSTKQCVASGVQYGLMGGIEKIVREMQSELNGDAQLLLTGGGSCWIRDQLDFKMRQELDLVLLGLARVAKCVK